MTKPSIKLPGLVSFRLCTLTDDELAQKCAAMLEQLYKDPLRTISRQIPARPNDDFDLLFGEMIRRFYFKDEKQDIQETETTETP